MRPKKEALKLAEEELEVTMATLKAKQVWVKNDMLLGKVIVGYVAPIDSH